jgi:uncharacterized protein YprB with RNaseH-like and TPR domain
MDLRSRLRAIVQQERPTRTPAEASGPARELTYEPLSHGGEIDLRMAAAALGGVVHEEGVAGIVCIDRVWEGRDVHGRRRVASLAIEPTAPIRLFDPRLQPPPGWASRVVFFDIETTGLSGGAGTVAFLAGCAWFEGEDLRVRQFLMTGPAGEPALLTALERALGGATLLVTFNGRTFDLPTMETRWAFHRRASPMGDVAHFDMLPPARRLWARRHAGRTSDRRAWHDAEAQSCSLAALERTVVGFHRLDDVSGYEIPVRYFQFLRTGDAGLLAGVLEHNRHDLVSLAAITARALELAQDGPDACHEATERLGLGRLYERAGEAERAVQAYELAAAGDDAAVRAHALGRLAVLYRRAARHAEAAAAWEDIANLEGGQHQLSPLERRAVEALAIHHEHRARDLRAARRYAQVLETHAPASRSRDVRHRLQRLNRKLQAAGDTKGGPEAAPLFES